MECISKGKEHKKYEFGNKVSIIQSWNGVILGAKSFRKEYDGHTIDESLKQVFELTGVHLKELAGQGKRIKILIINYTGEYPTTSFRIRPCHF